MAGRFTLNILGTASAKPSLKRGSSAQLLQAAERLFLIDCSEGTQQRILQQNCLLKQWCSDHKAQGLKRLSKSALDCIFISHIHGDHLFGLFPLLSTMALNGRTKPLKLFGPNALGPVLNFYRSYWGDKDPFEVEFIPLKMKEPETVYQCGELRVKAFPLNHGIDTYGFLFEELPGCQYRKEAYKPRSYAYCSDTAPFDKLPEWIAGVDLLYHEATYMDTDAAKAKARFHSTVLDAASCALKAGAGHLLIGHYSSSIREEDIHGEYEASARKVFPNTDAVSDGDIFDLEHEML